MTDNIKREASCLCGQLKIVHNGVINKSSICHCYSCQKRTGSIFGSQVLLKKSELQINGNSNLYKHKGDSENYVSFYSCPICSSTLYWEIPSFTEEHFIVAVGCFADKDFPAPTFSVYEDRKHCWLTLPDTITEHMA